jgi:hypothetical protein
MTTKGPNEEVQKIANSIEQKGRNTKRRLLRNFFKWVGYILCLFLGLVITIGLEIGWWPFVLVIVGFTTVFWFRTRYLSVLLTTTVVLVLTNPGPEQFKNYSQSADDKPHTRYRRKANYFLFSTFSKEWAEKDDEDGVGGDISTEDYLGILGNFFWEK